jgi:DNA-directed RNA polymerase subunit RPC12/RpoP
MGNEVDTESSERLLIITRRDTLGQNCVRCWEGTYVESAVLYDTDQAVWCPVCGHLIPRWLTKAEVMSFAAQELDTQTDGVA